MLDLLATDEFADWFRALPDCDAEDVATALEVLRKLEVQDTTALSSDLLLWYQCLPGDFPPAQEPGGLDVSDVYHRVAARIHKVLRHLESPAVQASLAQVPMAQALRVRETIHSIKAHTLWRRMAAMARDEAVAKRALDQVERDYRAALEALGLHEPCEPEHSGSLRQLQLGERVPGMRILYGVNLEKQSALLVLGEHLDRRAYGPSVRRALSVWRQFAAGNEGEGLGPAPSSRQPL